MSKHFLLSATSIAAKAMKDKFVQSSAYFIAKQLCLKKKQVKLLLA